MKAILVFILTYPTKAILLFILTYPTSVYILYKLTYKNFNDLRYGQSPWLEDLWTTEEYNPLDKWKHSIKAFLFNIACIILVFLNLIVIDKYIGF
jgi:hypothetical protein